MGKLIPVPKYKLEHLYKRERLAVRAIARLYHCNGTTIHRKLKSFGIKTRSPSEAATKISISRKRLRHYYIGKKLSTIRIAQIYHCDDFTILKKLRFYKIRIRTRSEAISKFPKHDFKGSRSEKAYMIGFRLGDLYVEENGQMIIVRCSSTYQEQVHLIRNLFINYGHVYIRTTPRLSGERNIIVINCHLNKSFSFLLPKTDNIPTWIRRNRRFFLAFLAGYADAEAWIGMANAANRRFGQPIFQISTYDKNILHQIHAGLQKLNVSCPKPRIDSRKSEKRKQDCWGLHVSQQASIMRLLGLLSVYLRHPSKRFALERVRADLLRRKYARDFIHR